MVVGVGTVTQRCGKPFIHLILLRPDGFTAAGLMYVKNDSEEGKGTGGIAFVDRQILASSEHLIMKNIVVISNACDASVRINETLQ